MGDPKLAELLKENSLLKRAVAIQQSRWQDAVASKDFEISQLQQHLQQLQAKACSCAGHCLCPAVSVTLQTFFLAGALTGGVELLPQPAPEAAGSHVLGIWLYESQSPRCVLEPVCALLHGSAVYQYMLHPIGCIDADGSCNVVSL